MPVFYSDAHTMSSGSFVALRIAGATKLPISLCGHKSDIPGLQLPLWEWRQGRACCRVCWGVYGELRTKKIWAVT
jgi:hypothetical protein